MKLKVVKCGEFTGGYQLQDMQVADAQFRIEDDDPDDIGFIRALVITDVPEIAGREFADELVRRWNAQEGK